MKSILPQPEKCPICQSKWAEPQIDGNRFCSNLVCFTDFRSSIYFPVNSVWTWTFSIYLNGKMYSWFSDGVFGDNGKYIDKDIPEMTLSALETWINFQ